jgi:transcriptional regulator with XRE-family HTH domain
MANDMSIKIKQLRQAKGMTLEQVATIVGVGKSTVRKWETGMIANMRRDKIGLLAKALDTTPAYLMGWEDIDSIPPLDLQLFGSPKSEESELTEAEEMLLELFRRVPENKQEVVLEMIRLALKTQE